jgi:ubiquitin C-terminal hydrolase
MMQGEEGSQIIMKKVVSEGMVPKVELATPVEIKIGEKKNNFRSGIYNSGNHSYINASLQAMLSVYKD